MVRPETTLDEASRELRAAAHDAQVAFDCIVLGELDRAHTHALTARVAVDAAVTALTAALSREGEREGGREGERGREGEGGQEVR
jgi:hypothetical protein